MNKSITRGSYETKKRQVITNPTNVTVGSSSAASAALDPGDYYVVSDTACYIKQGAAPTASASTGYLPANFEIVVTVKTTDVDDKIAVIQHTSGGFLHITPVQAVD